MTVATVAPAAASASNLLCFMGEPLFTVLGFGEEEWLAQARRSIRRFRGSFNIYPNRDVTLGTSRCLLKTRGANASLNRTAKD